MADQATAAAHAADPMTIGGRTCLRDDVPAVLAGQLDSSPRCPRNDPRSLGYLSRSAFRPDPSPAIPGGCISGRYRYSSVGTLTGTPGTACRAQRPGAHGWQLWHRMRPCPQDLALAESQLCDYQARLGVPFLHDAYLSELTDLRDQLKAALAGKAPEPGSDSQPTTAEFAEKIKALKAAHTVEATPQRIRQKQISAEEPVTARIRRRTEAVPVSDPAIQPDVPEAGARDFPFGRIQGPCQC